MENNSKLKDYDYIIIGGGIAGVSCLEQLSNYESSSILLITASDFVKTISNVQSITKTLDRFDVEETTTLALENKFPRVCIIKAVVSGLDTQNQIVIADELMFRYRKLCICSGATPKVILPNHPLVLWIRDTESVVKFQERLKDSKRIMIVGNGGIATEMVYEVTGVEIIWAIKDKSLNATFIDAGAAEFLRPKLFEDKEDTKGKITKRHKYTIDSSVESKTDANITGGALGPDWHSGLSLGTDHVRHITIETEVHVSEVFSPDEFRRSKYWDKEDDTGTDWPVYILLSNGKCYGCDLIISATGVTPNVEVFKKAAPFALGEDGGLLVNESMETSIPNVYAAGDACTAGWNIAHHWFQLRLWTQARQMGCYAARCMWAALHKEEIYMDFCFEVFSHVTKFFGQNVVLLGLFNGQKLQRKYEILLRMTKGKEYIKCVMVDGRMQGAILIGESGLEETFENLIINQIDLSEYGEDLLDPSVDIEDYFD